MADPKPPPSNLSWFNLGGVLALAVLQGLSTFLGPVVVPPTPMPPVDSWFVTEGDIRIEAPEIEAIANHLHDGKFLLTGYPKTGPITRLWVTVGGTQPAPDPVPPVPPQPVPPGPIPPINDSFARALQAAFTAESATNKSASLQALIAGYSECESVIQSPEITTLGQLYAELRKTVISHVGIMALDKVRNVIATENSAILPTDGSLSLTPELRVKFGDQFRRAREALEKLK